MLLEEKSITCIDAPLTYSFLVEKEMEMVAIVSSLTDRRCFFMVEPGVHASYLVDRAYY